MIKAFLLFMICIGAFSASAVYPQDQGDLRKGKIGVQFSQNLHSSEFIADERLGSRFIRLFWNPSRSFSLYAAASLRSVRRDSLNDFRCKTGVYSLCVPVKSEYPSPSALSVGADYFPFDVPVYTGLRISHEKGFSHQALQIPLGNDFTVQQGAALIRAERTDVYSFEVPLGFRWFAESGVFLGTEISYMRKLGGGTRRGIDGLWGKTAAELQSAAIIPLMVLRPEAEGKDGIYWGVYAGFGF